MIKSTLRKLIYSLLFSLLYLPVYGQVFTFKQEQISIAALLDSISAKTNIKVAYDVNAVPADSLVSINVNRVHPYEFVQDLLEHNALRVSFKNNQIVISKAFEQQKQEEFFRINGGVIDADDKSPLPMVNISLKNKALGTITNTDGQFEFVLPKAYMSDTLSFSFLGYSPYNIPLEDVQDELLIELQGYDYKLPEVQITYQSTDDILEKLIRFKKDNYLDEQALLTGFFRESIKQDGEYVQVSEAIVEILKPTYHNVFSLERVRFVKGRKLTGLASMDQVNFKLEGGPFQFSRIDIARYQDFIPKSANSRTYKYSYDGVEYLDGEMVYKVGFSPIVDSGELMYKGQLFIHSRSYALVYVNFELTKRSLKYSRRALIKRTSRRIKAKPRKAKYYIDYRMYQGKWILNKIGGELVVQINDKDQKINSEFVGISELLISDCEIDSEEKFKSAELFKPNYVLSEEIKETDEVYWENYNIIKPNEELERVFKKDKENP